MKMTTTMTTQRALRGLMAGLLLLAAGAPAAQAASAFTEDFSAGTLPPNFEILKGSGLGVQGVPPVWNGTWGPVFDNGSVRFSGSDTRGDNSGNLRSYLRTIQTDYASVDFVAEVTVTIPYAGPFGAYTSGRNAIFFGLGNASPVDIYGGASVQGVQMVVLPTNFFPRVRSVDGTPDGQALTVADNTSFGGNGTHRLRIEWSACTQTAVLSVDQNYTGGPFVADCVLPTIDGSDNGFDATNARIYFGGDWNAVFDDLVVTVNLPPVADAGAAQSVEVGDTVLLDGIGSTDDHLAASELSYSWSIASAPAGSAAALADAGTIAPSFVPDVAGSYVVQVVVSDGDCDDTATTVITVAEKPVDPKEAAKLLLALACDEIDALTPSQVTTKGNQRALCNFIKEALEDIDKCKLEDAIKKLQDAMSKTDGVPLRGAVDGKGRSQDWVTDGAAQTFIYGLLNDAVAALKAAVCPPKKPKGDHDDDDHEDHDDDDDHKDGKGGKGKGGKDD